MNAHRQTPERRSRERFYGYFSLQIRGVRADGHIIKTHTIADNISSGGLYLRLPHDLLPCRNLFVFARMPGGSALAARGRIVRQERPEDSLTGLGVQFTHFRLIPPRINLQNHRCIAETAGPESPLKKRDN